jgi:sugar phosphate isomerase/epimerase
VKTTRRDFTRAAALSSLGALSANRILKAEETRIHGVRFGVGTYTFRGMALDQFIPIVQAAKVKGIELDAPFVPEPEGEQVRKKLDKAGIEVYAYFVPLNDTVSDEALDRALQMTKALGSSVLNTQTSLPVAKRIAPLAEKHKIRIGLHPSAGKTPAADAIGSGESYRKAFSLSPSLHACLDLYLYKNWAPDPIAFLKEFHSRVTTLHLHDRKTAPAQWVPFGEGDLPVKEVLQLAKQEKYKFAFSIERIYTSPGLDHLTELRRSVDYCRKVLS